MSLTTAPSSAEILQFEPNQPANRPEHNARALKFAQASKTWLQQWHEDRRLSQSEKTVCTQIYLHFNMIRFEKSGKLVAWPSWATLMARTGLGKTSVFRRLRNLERFGALQIEHGRYNQETKKRIGNLYRARESKVASAQPSKEDQGCISVPNQGCTSATRLGDRDSVNISKRADQGSLPATLEGSKQGSGLPRGPSAPKEGSKQARNQWPPGPPFLFPLSQTTDTARRVPNAVTAMMFGSSTS